MEIVGWLFLVFVGITQTYAYFFVAWCNLGKYNLGGVPNSLKKKTITCLVGLVLIAIWVILLRFPPFTISIVNNDS